ncbi:hypothetical protein AVEN_14849-2 [Araneus ventricosus]|uniref:Uncharacterized protein n=2 Tax=Araneus ventricosus TaxID=182803 RepID=A0A4Y2WMY5_ARAVE|nr:hypothetical protein AVEN_14849-2 [Araneus ventricosus]
MTQVPTIKGGFYKRISSLSKDFSESRGWTCCVDCDFLAVVASLYPEYIRNCLVSPLVVEYNGTYTRALTVLLNHMKSVNDLGRCSVQIVTEFDQDFLNHLRYQMLQDEPISL